MKVLIPAVNIYANNENPYVRSLILGINSQCTDVQWKGGLDIFWSEECYSFDIIHVQWPEKLLGYSALHAHSSNELEKRLRELKRRGVKIVATCHNLEPHYVNSEDSKLTYKIVYSLSDCILHLGNYSLDLFRKLYPNVRHELLLHHIYDNIYDSLPTPSYEESIQHLGLNKSYKYILCFGSFRANEERNLILEIANKYRGKNIKILAPSFYRIPNRRNPLIVGYKYLGYLYYKLRYPNIAMVKRYVDDSELPYYYGASSISLIQRLKLLNSGSVSMGFYMKKCVVGPNVGNVGEWLQETGNPVFIPGNMNSVYEAIELALSKENQGEINYRYALDNLSSKRQSSRLYNIYRSLLSLS